MPRQADPATPEELAERIAKLPAWARKHIEAREELIRLLGGQLAEAQRNLTRSDVRDVRFGDGFFHVLDRSMEGAEVLIVEGGDTLAVQPVSPSKIIIARG